MKMRKHLIHTIRNHTIALSGQESDYSPLLEMIGDARFVLIGEATHGTKEFYHTRAEITKQLIRYYGFSAVAVEADWPDSYRVNRYVRGDKTVPDAQSALSAFNRFPAWMWRNEEMVSFTHWLRTYNDKRLSQQGKVGFYGLDLYSMRASIEAVIAYLDKVDPQAARRARDYYGCFDLFDSGDPQNYGYATSFGYITNCKQEAIQQLVQLRRHAHEYMKRDGYIAEEDLFCAEQNAKAVVGAEAYYRAIFESHITSWNLRDQHMVETLNALADHLSTQRQEPAKIVVWAHNSHVGDARATEMGEKGEWNLGQLVREQHGLQDTRLIGFSTYRGTVTETSEWDGEAQQKIIRPALPETYEHLFHETEIPNFLLLLRGNKALGEMLHLNRLQRAVGVLYLPESERQSHYLFARLTDQFDAIIHLDTTTALTPLEAKGLWHKGEVFETYPSAM